MNEQIRMKVLETLVRIEPLSILNSEKGLTIFGQLCEMAGQCCVHLANGRPDQAKKVAETVGRALPHAFTVGAQRDEFEQAIEDLIALFESSVVVFH